MRRSLTMATIAAVAAATLLAMAALGDDEGRELPQKVRSIYRRPADYQRLPTATSRAAQTAIQRITKQHALRDEAPEQPTDEERRSAAEQAPRLWQSYLAALTRIDPWLDAILGVMQGLGEDEEEGDLEQREAALERAPEWQQNMAQHLQGAGGYEIVNESTVRFAPPYTGVHPAPDQGSLPGTYQIGEAHMINYGQTAAASVGLVSAMTDVMFMNDFFISEFLVIEFDAWKSGQVVSSASIADVQCQCGVYGVMVGDSMARVQMHSNLHCQGESVDMASLLLTAPPPLNEPKMLEQETRSFEVARIGDTIDVQAGAPVRIMIGLSAQALSDSITAQAGAFGACTVSSVMVEIRD